MDQDAAARAIPVRTTAPVPAPAPRPAVQEEQADGAWLERAARLSDSLRDAVAALNAPEPPAAAADMLGDSLDTRR